MTAVRPRQAERGRPDASPFPTQRRSGTTDSWSEAHSFARASESGEDLVDDQEPAAFVAERPEAGQEPPRGNPIPASALDRFDQNGSDLKALCRGLDRRLPGYAEGHQNGQSGFAVGPGPGRGRGSHFARSHRACQEKRHGRNLRRPGCRVDRWPGWLSSSAASTASEPLEPKTALACMATGKAGDEFFKRAEPDIRWVNVAEPMEQYFGLLMEGFHDVRVGVADIGHAERGGQIEVLIFIDVPDVGSLRAGPEDGRGRQRGDALPLDRRESLRQGA